MRIAQLIPGTADTFYCQNCLRDAGLTRVLRSAGHDVLLVPMYLPLLSAKADPTEKVPMFFGGINVFLQQKIPFFRRTPRWIDRWLDSRRLLRWAAGRSNLADARELGQTMLSMLRGEGGFQSKEYRRFIDWMVLQPAPDVIVLSNVLLVGLVPLLRKSLPSAIVCLLEDEDEFLDELPVDITVQAQRLIADAGREIDAFISCSEYYAGVARDRFAVPADRLYVVPNAVDIQGYEPAHSPPAVPTIGYLSRAHPDKGLDLLAQAFVLLKRQARMRSVRLRIAGGHTPDDRPFLAGVMEQLRSAGVMQDVEVLPNLDTEARAKFLQSLTVLSVPTRRPEAFGVYMLEALASAVPVVQADHGACRELLDRTGGGMLVKPNDAAALAQALGEVLEHPQAARDAAKKARHVVADQYNLGHVAARTLEIYQLAVTRRATTGASRG